MGFLKDVGRTNAIAGQMQAITGLARGLRQDDQRDRTLDQADRRTTIMEQRQAIQNYDFKKQLEEDKRLDTPQAADPLFDAQFGYSESAKKHAMETAEAMGWTTMENGVRTITPRKLREARDWLTSNTKESLEWAKASEQSFVSDLENDRQTILQAMQTATPKELPMLQEQLTKVDQLKNHHLRGSDEVSKFMIEEAARRETDRQNEQRQRETDRLRAERDEKSDTRTANRRLRDIAAETAIRNMGRNVPITKQEFIADELKGLETVDELGQLIEYTEEDLIQAKDQAELKYNLIYGTGSIAEETATVDGVEYEKIDGKWYPK